MIKVDVEGFEYLVIRGSEAILTKGIIENFIIKIHPIAMKSLGHSSSHISEMLIKYGYKEKIISDNLLLFTLCKA